jgi:hypothetical protein
MAYGNCNNCGAGISWDKQKREAMNTRRPLNYDGTIHDCQGGVGSGSSSRPSQQQQQQQQRPRPPLVDQEQKSLDIKAAQVQRKKEHDELIKNMQWLTKMLAFKAEQDGGGSASEILDGIGFREFQEEQHQEGYDDL